MGTGRDRLIDAVRSLLATDPRSEPSTREIYDVAGVAAPTLYHHFGTKNGLLEAVVEDAFLTYLKRKRAVRRSGDLLVDFAAGWDMHVEFGVENPFLYELMYGRASGRRSATAAIAEQELHDGLQRLATTRLLTMSIDDAVAVTTATAIGCVTQLNYSGEPASSPTARAMREALITRLTEKPGDAGTAGSAARTLLSRLGSTAAVLSSAEESLLKQWLITISEARTPGEDQRP